MAVGAKQYRRLLRDYLSLTLARMSLANEYKRQFGWRERYAS